jgi:sugar/nucleoside kinase (ribokinase family)
LVETISRGLGFVRCFTGATQNSIRVAQWMLQTPKSTVYVGCTGKDAFSARLRDCAEADGVAVHYMHVCSPPPLWTGYEFSETSDFSVVSRL